MLCLPVPTLDPKSDVYINVCPSLRSLGFDSSFKSEADLTASFVCEYWFVLPCSTCYLRPSHLLNSNWACRIYVYVLYSSTKLWVIAAARVFHFILWKRLGSIWNNYSLWISQFGLIACGAVYLKKRYKHLCWFGKQRKPLLRSELGCLSEVYLSRSLCYTNGLGVLRSSVLGAWCFSIDNANDSNSALHMYQSRRSPLLPRPYACLPVSLDVGLFRETTVNPTVPKYFMRLL